MDLPLGDPPDIATRPVIPLRSVTAFNAEAVAVRVLPFSWKIPLMFTVLLLSCNAELVPSPS
jgi:hypothetical protein